MVLVDTSVWIRVLANWAPYAAELGRLLSMDQVVGHQLVYGELLIGDRGGRKKLLLDYERMSQAEWIPHREVVEFVAKHRIHGLGVGWIDAHLLASAILGQFEVWTADERFAALAVEFGVGYDLPNSTLGRRS